MKRQSLLSFLIILIIFPAFGQNKGQVIGTVRDKNTLDVLVGVSVLVEGTSLGSVTDLEGRFKIADIPVGSYNIRASFIGYTTLVRYKINVTSGNDQILTLELQEEVAIKSRWF